MGALTDFHAGVVELRGRATSRAVAGKKERRGRSGGVVKEAVARRLAPSSNELAAAPSASKSTTTNSLPPSFPLTIRASLDTSSSSSSRVKSTELLR